MRLNGISPAAGSKKVRLRVGRGASAAVADHGQRGEAELAATLHDLRGAVHGHQFLGELVRRLILSFNSCHLGIPSLKFG